MAHPYQNREGEKSYIPEKVDPEIDMVLDSTIGRVSQKCHSPN